MLTESFATPVALFVFNRPDTTRRVFDAISSARPRKLFLIADGPRADKPGEEKVCLKVREIITHVDWPCEVSTNFADNNLGCQERVVSGLNWVFSIVEEAIILEDDCLPDSSFFPFCQELLERYRGDDRVAYITGINFMEQHLKTSASYYFSQFGGIWGWATWRSKWQRYDRYLEDWPTLRESGMLSEIYNNPKIVAYLTRIFDSMHSRTGPNTWDHQWMYTCLKNNSLIVVPRVNLITNIGFGVDATHTLEYDARLTPTRGTLKFPLNHPPDFVPLRSIDHHLIEILLLDSIFSRVLRKTRRLLRCLKT